MSKRLTLAQFISRAKIIHKGKYDYSRVVYVNWTTKVDIICPKHGVFQQVPNSHLIGYGCARCGSEKLSKLFRLKKEDIIKKANTIHGRRYKYLIKNVKNNRDFITVICPKHGKFKQKVMSHLAGDGCPLCKCSRGELRILKFLEENKVPFIRENIFEGCRGPIRPLPFDFYLPAHGICIEYDGAQHFDKDSRFYSEQLIRNDRIKNKYCKDNNILLLRIPYKKFKKVYEILEISIMRAKLRVQLVRTCRDCGNYLEAPQPVIKSGGIIIRPSCKCAMNGRNVERGIIPRWCPLPTLSEIRK